ASQIVRPLAQDQGKIARRSPKRIGQPGPIRFVAINFPIFVIFYLTNFFISEILQAMQYFVVMIDYGRRGREAIVEPEITRREVISRVACGEYGNISFIHEVLDRSVDDVTAEIMAEAALPDVAAPARDRQADRFDHAGDLRKHERA